MASDFNLVDPSGWELDLHSVYSAYMGHFQLHNVLWFERSWASLFTSFDAFLAFGWPGVVVSNNTEPKDPTAALGFANAMKDLPLKTTAGGVLYVFTLPR